MFSLHFDFLCLHIDITPRREEQSMMSLRKKVLVEKVTGKNVILSTSNEEVLNVVAGPGVLIDRLCVGKEFFAVLTVYSSYIAIDSISCVDDEECALISL